jgi:glucose-1-phosphate adenylyltransferase
MERALAMVLAGGRGKRMDILCNEKPKPALPFAGSFRVIDFSLSNCVHSQIRRFAVLVDYQRSNIANYLRRWRLVNAGYNEVHVLEPKIGSYLGTADAIYQNLDYLEEYEPEDVLLLAGDHIYKMDYRHMLAWHKQINADVTIGVINVLAEQTHRFGIVTTDSEGKIVDFAEKPAIPQSGLASMGIYIFKRQVLVQRLIEDAAQSDSLHDFGYSIVPGMIKRDRVFAYRFNGYWQDIGTIEAYYQANMELTSRMPSFSLDGSWPILTGNSTLPPPKLSHQGSIRNSLISPGCVIQGCVENSILSPNVWIDEQATVRNSVIMANTFIGYHSVVENTIVDESVNIGKHCYIGVGETPTPIEGELTVLGKDATVPAYTAIRRNCKILPRTGSDDFISNAVPDCYNFASSNALFLNTPDKERVTSNERQGIHVADYL